MESTISCPRDYESNSHSNCFWNYHINIVGRHINLFSGWCLSNTEFKNDKMKHNDTVNPTSQIGHHWSNITPRSFWNWSISYHKSILKRHFMPETFISIDNNLQRRVRLHNIDRLSQDTAFWNRHFYMPNVIWEEILVFFHVIPVYALPQHITFSDLKPKLK